MAISFGDIYRCNRKDNALKSAERSQMLAKKVHNITVVFNVDICDVERFETVREKENQRDNK